ncbi:MAG: betaine--homocysteine S-methyltransferase [Rhodospirillales bacterium]
MTNRLQKLLDEKGVLLADGATGTNLFALGLQSGDAPEQWNLDHPDRVRENYRSFIGAGCDLSLTNTFGGTANRLKLHGLEGRVREINRIAAELLCEEIKASGREIICAGSVGPTGDLFEPLGPLTHKDGVSAFTEQMLGLKDGGADIAWIETMSSEDEVNAALEAADSVGLPAVCTLSFDTNGRTMMGVTPVRMAECMHGHAHPPLAFGGNCGNGASDLLAGLLSMQDAAAPADVIVAKANCGVPEYKDGEIVYSGTPETMAVYTRMARALGARIIGGCCGTTAVHLRAMRAVLDEPAEGAANPPPPGLDEITAALGPLTGTTETLLHAPGQGPGGEAAPSRTRAGRRRRRD